MPFNFVDVALNNHVEVEPVDRDGTRYYPIPNRINIIRALPQSHRSRTHSSSQNGEEKQVNKRLIELLLEQHREAPPFTHLQKIISKVN